ncbi:MAG: UvrD-helicase domain-containing protein [Phycisphaerales bacterium]|nr:UvrD-helicase domain-containing protein [Phycisphaerales bacterium]
MMEFRIADTFTDSLAKLNGNEQKAVKQTAFDLQLDPTSPGLSFHKLDRAKDKNFWSMRVSRDIRIIVHKTKNSLLLCYVDHHDDAYIWAQKRKIEVHPKTGAAQLVEVRETVQEIKIPQYVEAPTQPEETKPQPALFDKYSDDDLMGYGVPEEWLGDVKAANEDELLSLVDHLPGEAAEALLELATGGVPTPSMAASTELNPFEHPDAQRRFKLFTDSDELEQALNFPWEKWAVFLHPDQRHIVEHDFNGPARVSGSAGTGKTVVALHRAVSLAKRNPEAKVFVTTFTPLLSKQLDRKLSYLTGNNQQLAERIVVQSIDEFGIALFEKELGQPAVPTQSMIKKLLVDASSKVADHKFTTRFLESEWHQVVDAWQLDSWEAYRDVARLGRKTRLGENHRKLLWEIFKGVREILDQRGLITISSIFGRLAKESSSFSSSLPDFVVVDEAQDITVPQLRFLATSVGDSPNRLFFAGDLGQRIFQTPFSWKSLGVDIRGRSRTLHINYRTSQQIREQADRLLPEAMSDVDGIRESRRGTVSAFSGPPPVVSVLDTIEAEYGCISDWLKELFAKNYLPEEVCLIVRSDDEIPRAQAAVKTAENESFVLDANSGPSEGMVSVCTMHMAKGLEFRAVAVVACDDEIVPLQSRMESIADNADLEDVYETERHLLYVACTRARDQLLVTGVEPASEFLDDLLGC